MLATRPLGIALADQPPKFHWRHDHRVGLPVRGTERARTSTPPRRRSREPRETESLATRASPADDDGVNGNQRKLALASYALEPSERSERGEARSETRRAERA